MLVCFLSRATAHQAALKYSEAQMRIDDVSDTSPVTLGLRTLNMLAKKLRQRRLENGALLLASTEVWLTDRYQ